MGPPKRCCVSERAGSESLDPLEAFQKGLVHGEGAQHWPVKRAVTWVCPSAHAEFQGTENLGDAKSHTLGQKEALFGLGNGGRTAS